MMSGACADSDNTEDVTFKVISYGGNFRGSYVADGGTTKSFTGVSIGNDSYSFEKEVEIEDQLEVEADAIYDEDGENELTSLEIKIYVDDELVKNVEDSDSVEKISLIYTIGESSADEDD